MRALALMVLGLLAPAAVMAADAAAVTPASAAAPAASPPPWVKPAASSSTSASSAPAAEPAVACWEALPEYPRRAVSLQAAARPEVAQPGAFPAPRPAVLAPASR